MDEGERAESVQVRIRRTEGGKADPEPCSPLQRGAAVCHARATAPHQPPKWEEAPEHGGSSSGETVPTNLSSVTGGAKSLWSAAPLQ